MNKYHINRNTGRVGICRATVRECPIGGEHFNTKEEAVKNKEYILKNNFNMFTTFQKDHTKDTDAYSYEIDDKLKKMIWKRLRKEYQLKDLKKMTIDKNTLFSSSGGLEISCDYNDAKTEAFFSRGKCAWIAYELHKQTKLPFVIFTDDDMFDNHGIWQGHIAILKDDNTIVDITGSTDEEEIRKRYSFIKNLSKRVIDEEEFFKIIKYRNEETKSLYHDYEDLEEVVVEKICKDLKHDFID